MVETYSSERYANPFFMPASSAAKAASDGVTQQADWTKQQLGPVPPLKGDGKGIIDLAGVIGAQGVAEIAQLGAIRFHALGDSGSGNAEPAEDVAKDMAADFAAGAGALNPAFLLHLGDVMYNPNKEAHYLDRFYRPYRKYLGKILAIAGNHDGETTTSPADSPSLQAFKANFCADVAAVPKPAADAGIYRKTMTQPGVYWMLDAPFVRIIGLYSNRLEDFGFLEGDGGNDKTQLTWLATTLQSIANNQAKKALIIVTHHPPYSLAGHPSSVDLGASIDALCQAAGVWPDAFLSGHSHNYQRFMRHVGGRQIPYIVAGTGGLPPIAVPPAAGLPVNGSDGVTYEKAMASTGYLYITVSAHDLKIEFWPHSAGGHATVFDPIVVDLNTHVVSSG